MVAHTHTFTGSALAAHTHTDSGHTHTAATRTGQLGTGGGSNYLCNGDVSGVSYANISSVSAGTPAGTNSSTTGVSWTPRYIDMIICSKN